MSMLTEFYSGTATGPKGRDIESILAWSDDELEEVHDYIQWLFPTPTRSEYHPHAPVLTHEDINEFRRNEVMLARLRKAFTRFLEFLGLAFTQNGRIVEAANFEQRSKEIWIYENHNWLRISRILISLRAFGLESEAQNLFAWLKSAYGKGTIGSGDGNSRSEAAVSFAQWAKHAEG